MTKDELKELLITAMDTLNRLPTPQDAARRMKCLWPDYPDQWHTEATYPRLRPTPKQISEMDWVLEKLRMVRNVTYRQLLAARGLGVPYPVLKHYFRRGVRTLKRWHDQALTIMLQAINGRLKPFMTVPPLTSKG